MGVLKLADGRYRVQIRRKGFPHYDQLFTKKSEAVEAMQKRLGQMTEPVAPAKELTLQGAWDKYHDSIQFSRKAEVTRKTEESRIKPVLASLGSYSLENLATRPSIVMDYIEERAKVTSEKTGRKLSGTSIRLEVAALSSIAIWAVKRRLLIRNFVADVQRPTQTKRKRRVPPVEQGSLYQIARQTDDPMDAQGARFLLLMRYLGCRPGELAGLLKSDIRFVQHDVTFRNTKHEGEDRLVHVTDQAEKYLEAQYRFAAEYAPASPYLFSTKKRGADPHLASSWGEYNYAWSIKRLKAEGVVGDGFHAHAMRREYISRAIETGVPYATIRKQTGHHSTQAIEIYDEGLSTAPEIRQALDAHDKILGQDLIPSLLASAGLDEMTINKVLLTLADKQATPITRYLPNGEVVPIKPKS